MSTISIAFAANRQIGVDCLKILLEEDIVPESLILPEGGDQNDALRALLPDVPTCEGKDIDPALVEGKDYLLSVHFPHIIKKEILDLPSVGTLNLHPAFLPYNKGWHTPTWAIYDGTPFGVTLHWIDEGIDTGPIALQEVVEVLDNDTAHELYQRGLAAEAELFRSALPMLVAKTLPSIPQEGEGTSHKKEDLESIRCIPGDASDEERDRITRACTTNKPEEAAYNA